MQPRDGHVKTLVNDFRSHLTTCFCQVTQTFSAFLDKLAIIDPELVEQDRDKLVHIVNDLGLSRYV